MVEFINTEKLIERFDDMARRESLLIGKQVTQDDLVCQIVGTIVKEAMDEDRPNIMKAANTIWQTGDIEAGLDDNGILATSVNIAKVATPEFVRSFHDRIVEFGNEMIAAQVREVFADEIE